MLDHYRNLIASEFRIISTFFQLQSEAAKPRPTCSVFQAPTTRSNNTFLTGGGVYQIILSNTVKVLGMGERLRTLGRGDPRMIKK